MNERISGKDPANEAKISIDALSEVQRALKRYEAELDTTRLKDSAKRTYLLHAKNFVRWLADDFDPGSKL